jgi:asparagine synthase (glutamine-hydrolysing)
VSRIVALLNRDGRPARPDTLRQLIAPLRHSAADGPRFWVSGAAGLAYQCLRFSSSLDEIQPAVQPPSIAVCFDGRLDNREELIHMLSADLTADAADLSDAALVLACYRRFGDGFATHLNGDFAIAVGDVEQRRLLLARDIVGVRPLYYWTSGRTAVAASEIKAILAHPEVEAQPDNDALADFLIGGDPHESRLTCFRDIIRVLPGFTVIVTPERVQELRHWDFDPTRQIRLASVGEYAEALRELFEKAVLRRLRSADRVAVTVSGGLDSSAVLCQAEKLRQAGSPVAQAFGISQVFPDGTTADEKRYLPEIEAMYRLEIRKLPFDSFEYVYDRKWLWQTEFPRLHWDAEFKTFQSARELGCSVLLDGDYGDNVVASSAHLFTLARTFRWWRLKGEFRAFAQSLQDCSPHLLRREFLHRLIRDLAPDRLMYFVRSIRRLWNSDRSPGWYTKQFRDLAYRRSLQQRRPGGPFATRQAEICYRYFRGPQVCEGFEEANKITTIYGINTAHPFVDRDLISFVMAIPEEFVNWKGVYKGLFREGMRGILPEAIRQRSWKADFSAIDNGAAATSAYSGFEKYLHSGCLAIQLGYLDPKALPRALSSHKSKLTGERMLPASQANKLLALEVWLQAFFGPQSSSKPPEEHPVYHNGSTVPK